MKKFLCAVIVILFMISLCGDMSAASRVKYNLIPEDEDNEELFETPVNVPEEITTEQEISKQPDTIINTELEPVYEQRDEQAQHEYDDTYVKGKGIGRETDEYNKYQKDYLAKKKDDGLKKIKEPEEQEEQNEEDEEEGRNYQYGLQKWRKGATRQLANWTFSANKVTVELFKKGSSKPDSKYSMKPFKKKDPHSGFVFTWGISKGTQIVVPEGCEIHCDPSKVDMSTRTEDDKRGNGVAFSEGEVIYFKASTSPGFTIFPYHAWPLD